MPSPAEIANQALLELGQSPTIVDLEAEAYSGSNAQALWQAYRFLRPQVLQTHPWNDAIVTVERPIEATPEKSRYTASVVLPADCLRVVALGNGELEDNNANKFEIRNRKLCCDAVDGGPVRFTYIRDIEDMTHASPAFCNQLALQMAVRCCVTITGSSALKERLAKAAGADKVEARGTDAQERGRQQHDATSFVDAFRGA